MSRHRAPKPAKPAATTKAAPDEVNTLAEVTRILLGAVCVALALGIPLGIVADNALNGGRGDSAAAATMSTSSPTPTPSATATERPKSDAQNLLGDLKTVTGALYYSRDEFGSGWLDPDGNGCDAREDLLARSLTDITRRDRCRITEGTMTDPYTGQKVTGDTSKMQGDHRVSLADAWRTGAWDWSAAKRRDYANDPANLVLTTAHGNESKSDKGPDEWAPVDHAAACRYGKAYVHTKATWRLGVTKAQRVALEDLLAGCS